MLNRALSKAKKEGGKKVPINFQVPSELKEQFENLCKRNEVSLTSMLNGLMETAMEEAEGIYFELDTEGLLSINNRILQLEKTIFDIEDNGLEVENDKISRIYESSKRELFRLYKITNETKGENK